VFSSPKLLQSSQIQARLKSSPEVLCCEPKSVSEELVNLKICKVFNVLFEF